MRLVLFALIALMAPLAAFAHDYKKGDLFIDHPIAAPAVRDVTAGYMTIRNSGANPDRLIAATSPDAKAIELHTHVQGPGGMMQMRKLEDGIVIPAKGEAQLQPGGLHLMIFGAKKPLKEGEELRVTLIFERAGKVDVVLMVETPKAGGGHHHH